LTEMQLEITTNYHTQKNAGRNCCKLSK